MSDAQRRALRTLLQAIGSGLLVTLYQVFAPQAYRMSPEQVTAVTALLTALVSFTQNFIENNTGAAVLKPEVAVIRAVENKDA